MSGTEPGAELLRAALDALDAGIALVGSDDRIRWCNLAYANLLAAPPELLVGASLFGAGSPCEGLTELAARDGWPASVSLSGESHDGTSVDVIVRPVAPESSVRLVLVRRGFVRAAAGRWLPRDVVADVRGFLSGLTGHVADDGILSRAPLSILVLAIEENTEPRDADGEPAMEDIIRQVAQVLVLEKRKSDIVSRYGNGRFLVLAPETPGHRAALLAERFAVGVLPVRLLVASAEYRPHLDGSIRDAVERVAAALRPIAARSAPDAAGDHVDTAFEDA